MFCLLKEGKRAALKRAIIAMDKNLGEIKPRQKFGITNESSAYGKYKYKMAFAASC